MPDTHAVSSEFPVDENAIRVPYDRLKDFMTQIFQAVGLPDGDAEGLARAMADGDLLGKDSHGCIRVPMYVSRIKGGAINKTPHIRVEKQTPAMAIVNGDNGMGHLVARYSMELAMDMAAKSGGSACSIPTMPARRRSMPRWRSSATRSASSPASAAPTTPRPMAAATFWSAPTRSPSPFRRWKSRPS
jgi:hypothetical protein